MCTWKYKKLGNEMGDMGFTNLKKARKKDDRRKIKFVPLIEDYFGLRNTI